MTLCHDVNEIHTKAALCLNDISDATLENLARRFSNQKIMPNVKTDNDVIAND